MLTWGLLSPGKGIEHGIRAVARVIHHSRRAASYIVAGQTHPKVRAAEGERYREALQAQSRSLGIAGRVRFDGSYRDWESLRALVRSVDVVLLPYESRDQASSGVLVEALASAKPVVATRFPHAEEVLAGGAGILVGQGRRKPWPMPWSGCCTSRVLPSGWPPQPGVPRHPCCGQPSGLPTAPW